MSDGGSQLPLQRLTQNGSHIEKETIVEESAIELYALDQSGNFYSHATLLATPFELIELYAGHIHSEGYSSSTLTLDSFKIQDSPQLHVEYHGKLSTEPRTKIVTSSCGACNHPDLSIEKSGGILEQNPHQSIDLIQIYELLNSLTNQMSLFQQSGGSHGCGLFFIEHGIRFVSEDIGRHNAVDKAIGKAILNGGVVLNQALLLLSGRCGWDIVAKAVRTGIPAIASLGAFSTAAIHLAREHNLVLYGFVKENGAWKVGS